MRQLASVLAILLVFASGLVDGEESYDEPLVATDAFRQAWENEDYESAFLVLRPSENSPDSHPVDLMILAEMYKDAEIPKLGTDRDRALKYWELIELAALTGYEPAVIEWSNAFLWGDEVLGYQSDEEMADCLDGIIEQRAYVTSDKDWLDSELVMNCLLQENSPVIGIFRESESSE